MIYTYGNISLAIGTGDDRLLALDFIPNQSATKPRSPLEQLIKQQLDEYFKGKRQSFQIPLRFAGTPFQVTVWNALLDIPYGKTETYGQLAARIGRPKAYRAVGNALNRNPIGIIVPCHRVLGSDGSLTGFGGGLETKKFLLELEQA